MPCERSILASPRVAADAARGLVFRHAVRKRIVPAGVQHQELDTRGVVEGFDDVVELDQVERRECAAVQLQIDRHQIVVPLICIPCPE